MCWKGFLYLARFGGLSPATAPLFFKVFPPTPEIGAKDSTRL
jgi:hypothetical protein